MTENILLKTIALRRCLQVPPSPPSRPPALNLANARVNTHWSPSCNGKSVLYIEETKWQSVWYVEYNKVENLHFGYDTQNSKNILFFILHSILRISFTVHQILALHLCITQQNRQSQPSIKSSVKLFVIANVWKIVQFQPTIWTVGEWSCFYSLIHKECVLWCICICVHMCQWICVLMSRCI